MNTKQNATQPNYRKDCLLQNLKIVLFAVLAAVLLLLTALELRPTALSDLQIETPFRVSSSIIDATNKIYSSSLTGKFVNESDEEIVVEKLVVTVSNGKFPKEIELGGFTLPPRTSYDVPPEEWTGIYAYDRITRVEVTIDGEVDVLANVVSSPFSISGIAIFYLILLAVVAIFLVRACKIRYYICQEMQLVQNGSQEE